MRLTQHKMGSLQDLPHVDMMAPITKFAATVPSTERVADMVSMAVRECYNGAWGPSYLEIPRDVLDREVDRDQGDHPRSPATTAPRPARSAIRADIEKLADLLVNAERPCILLGTQVWNCRGHKEAIELVRQLNIPAYFNGSGRGLLPPGDPHHFNRTRRMAFDKADVIVIVGTPFDFRMGYGRRLGRGAQVVQIDQDYRTVGKNRDISLGMVGHPGAILGAVAQAASGRADNRAKSRLGWMEELQAAEQTATDKLMPLFTVRQLADPSLSGGLGDQRVPDRGHGLYRRRRRRRDDQRPGGAAAPARPLDGPGRARRARRRHGLRHGRQARPSRARRCSATTATAPSA